MVERFRVNRTLPKMVRAKDGPWMRYADHESELATLRARVEELEREVNALLSSAAAKGDEPDLLVTEWRRARRRAERAEEAFEIANKMRLEATKQAVEALKAARWYVDVYDTREHNSEQDATLRQIDTALDRLTNIMGESNG